MTALQSVPPTRFFEEHNLATEWKNRPMTSKSLHNTCTLFSCFFSRYWYDRDWARLLFVVTKTNLLTLQPWVSHMLWKIEQQWWPVIFQIRGWLSMVMIICIEQLQKKSWCWCKLYPQEILDILQPFCAPCYCSYWLIGWHCNYCPRYDITICPGRTRNKGWLVARIKIRYYVHNNKYSESLGEY